MAIEYKDDTCMMFYDALDALSVPATLDTVGYLGIPLKTFLENLSERKKYDKLKQQPVITYSIRQSRKR